MAESIQIILEGVDDATPAFEQVAEQIANTSSETKKLSGTFSKIFGSMGLDELSAFAGQFGNVAGQLKDLGEAGQKGGAGMIAAKVGIAAAVGAAAFNIGKMFSDWALETDKFKVVLEDALDAARKGEEQVREQLQKQFELKLQIVNLSQTESQKKEELATLEQRLSRDIAQQHEFISMRKKALDAAAASNYFGLNENSVRLEQEGLKAEQEKLATLQKQRDEIRDIQNVSADEQMLIDRQKAQEDYRKSMADMQKAADEGWRELSKQMQDEAREREDQAKRNKDYLENLAAQNMELTKGKRAAEEYRAELSGISKATIEAGREVAIQNELLDAQSQLAQEQKKTEEERRKKLAEPTPNLQATESRLLSRVATGGGDRMTQAAEKTADLTEKIEKLQQELLTEQRKKGNAIAVELAGGR
jgi:hypothetical protein